MEHIKVGDKGSAHQEHLERAGNPNRHDTKDDTKKLKPQTRKQNWDTRTNATLVGTARHQNIEKNKTCKKWLAFGGIWGNTKKG